MDGLNAMKSIILFSILFLNNSYADCEGVCNNKRSPALEGGNKASIDSILSDSNEAMFNSLPDKSLVTKKSASKSTDEIVTVYEKSDSTMKCTKTKTEVAKKTPTYSYSCEEKK